MYDGSKGRQDLLCLSPARLALLQDWHLPLACFRTFTPPLALWSWVYRAQPCRSPISWELLESLNCQTQKAPKREGGPLERD